MQILLWLLILPILLVLCILTAYRVPLPTSLAGSRDLVAALTAGVAGIGYLLALALYLLWSLRRSARGLDSILEPMGLVGSRYAGFGRRYTGLVEGRQVEVRYLPSYALHATRLDVTVDAELGMRMAVSTERPLLDCRNCPRLYLGENVPYRVYAQDQLAAQQWLAHPEVWAALGGLMDVEGTPALYMQPDRLWFRVRPRHVSGAEIEEWLWELVRLSSCP